MRSQALAACLGLLFLGVTACTTTTTTTPPPDYLPRQVIELKRWEIWSTDAQIGWLLHLEIQDPNGPIRYYRVENLKKQWVGHATEAGRFSRREPFREDDVDLGLWTMQKGVAKLFEAEMPVELRTFVDDRAAAEAAAKKDKK